MFLQYYIDPTNGYIFRSLKDIDRYLLTGKLGRHVTKTKPKDLDNSVVTLDMKPVPVSVNFLCLHAILGLTLALRSRIIARLRKIFSVWTTGILFPEKYS